MRKRGSGGTDDKRYAEQKRRIDIPYARKSSDRAEEKEDEGEIWSQIPRIGAAQKTRAEDDLVMTSAKGSISPGGR